ncbi:Eco57I restriction-modification methylase domain-containing protein [Neotamlana laminarinivorans]|uniref:site-specific DNA-methyltransferase (adenine-specific) n=1 Tax=Neotamlana laminarinivorans TaxID=2883124 RepID=A0A9X1L2X4_9FLAO|nr:TaqI-like C-terminal specificity domain-containing protein [Tamlana laminarinivorans]MCB4800248.1 N-6 DNA methylase [Tamlana laminarinivorans]
MSLYQSSVLKHYLKLQDSEAINKAYKKYTKYFLNPTIQDNIRSSKEEEYQGIFLTELFVNILDYTLKPKANFNLVAEYKNQNNARKADGAILHNDIAIGVIELKGTNTKDLESIRKQAFDYKANQKGCVYVITSNFEKLRFYINDATEFEEFNLFELTPERFELLYICLQKDNVLNNTALKIKEQSVVEEEQITKQFYKDYSVFKRELFRDLVKRNAKTLKAQASNVTSSAVERSQEELLEVQRLEKNVKLTLFKKSQKLIDRYLFIFFAEDRGLLPPNSTQQILDKWKADVDFGDDRPLYTLFKQYFKFLDQGRAGTSNRAEIYAYNGGLFKEDKTLDSLDIDSDLLYKHTCKLAAYDFESQVDVNILGHIFENSLNEIESVNAEIEGGDFDKQKSKRKKDGVFYTPKYITKYIVENTIGKLCDEKKTELGFKEEEYFKGRKNRNKTTITKLVSILDTYRDWLLQLTICDPACGSGAFLNQALNFLIAEHQYIDELKTKVLGGGLQFPDIENTILENNIYGVDLNEESVEIAKLSLWLRTAQPRRKLNDLSSNIKCGNSLIDSKAVAGDKAFNWQEQFPKVFEKGGFDVIIGNPPYVSSKGNNFSLKEKEYYTKYYECAIYQIDLYLLFNEKSIDIIKDNGVISLIEPNAWMNNLFLKPIRKYLLENTTIYEIVNTPIGVFKDATVDTVIITYSKKSKKAYSIKILEAKGQEIALLHNKSIESFRDNENYDFDILVSEYDKQIVSRIESNTTPLIELTQASSGIKEYERGKGNPPQSAEVVKNKPFNSNIKLNENYIEHISGTDVNRFVLNWQGNYLNYGEWIAAPRNPIFFDGERLIIREIPGKNSLIVSYTCDKYTVKNTAHVFKVSNNEYSIFALLGVLNSKLMGFYFKKKFSEDDDVFPKAKLGQCKKLPITISLKNNKDFDLIISNIISEIQNYTLLSEKFQNYIQQSFQLERLPKKLQNWHELEFGEFIKELNKAIKTSNKLRAKQVAETVTSSAVEKSQPVEIPTLTRKDEFEWLDLFEDNKQKAQALQAQINQTDKEIDQMVYELYGLTEEEVQIVENS